MPRTSPTWRPRLNFTQSVRPMEYARLMKAPPPERLSLLYSFVAMGIALEALAMQGGGNGMESIKDALARGSANPARTTNASEISGLAEALDMSGDFSLQDD